MASVSLANDRHIISFCRPALSNVATACLYGLSPFTFSEHLLVKIKSNRNSEIFTEDYCQKVRMFYESILQNI